MVQMLKDLKAEPSKITAEMLEEFKGIVFLNRKGLSTKNSTYDTYLYKDKQEKSLKNKERRNIYEIRNRNFII